jgi:hypothetical protein
MITLFKTVKEIRSKSGDLHFTRFAIIEIRNLFSFYIHRIYIHDKDLNLHNHPWNFAGLVLKGSYEEKTKEGLVTKEVGSLYTGDRSFFHKINRIINGPVTTLFLVWGKYKEWGYETNEGFVDSITYRSRKSA